MTSLHTTSVFKAFLSAICLAPFMTVDAQQAVVLQHGFQADRSTWGDAADRLAMDFVVTTYRYTTGSHSSFSDQEASFNSQRSADALPSNTIGVAHSNGSRVLRLSAQNGNQFSGIITVAGTHGGVPLVANAANGVLTTMGWFLGDGLVAPFDYYRDYEYQIPGSAYFLYAAADESASIVFWMLAGLDVGAGVAPFLGWPVLSEMPAALGPTTSEETNAPTRVGIVSQITHGLTGLAAHGVYPNQWEFVRNAQLATIGLGIALYDYFAFYLDETQPNYWPLYGGRYLWVEMAAAAYNVDWFWCDAIGALDYEGCHANDGILPSALQMFPNATSNVDIFGPAHQEETTSSQFYDALKARLILMGVQSR